MLHLKPILAVHYFRKQRVRHRLKLIVSGQDHKPEISDDSGIKTFVPQEVLLERNVAHLFLSEKQAITGIIIFFGSEKGDI